MLDDYTHIDLDDDDPFLIVREQSDEQILADAVFLTQVYTAILAELAFRSMRPDHQDGTVDLDHINHETLTATRREVTRQLTPIVNKHQHDYPNYDHHDPTHTPDRTTEEET